MFQPLVVAAPVPECLDQVVREMEAHAEAARDFIMIELVTKQDSQRAFDTVTLRLTVRLGMIVAAAVAVLGAGLALLALFLKAH